MSTPSAERRRAVPRTIVNGKQNSCATASELRPLPALAVPGLPAETSRGCSLTGHQIPRVRHLGGETRWGRTRPLGHARPASSGQRRQANRGVRNAPVGMPRQTCSVPARSRSLSSSGRHARSRPSLTTTKNLPRFQPHHRRKTREAQAATAYCPVQSLNRRPELSPAPSSSYGFSQRAPAIHRPNRRIPSSASHKHRVGTPFPSPAFGAGSSTTPHFGAELPSPDSAFND